MGKRAVPFLYEMLLNNEKYAIGILEQIYGCTFSKGANNIREARIIALEAKEKWIKKIEEEEGI